MRIISWNVNGLRSVVRKGFLDWVKRDEPDILCLQEVKIQESEVPFDLLYLENYHATFHTSERPGYAGVIIYSKEEPLKVRRKLAFRKFDTEGRYLEIKLRDFVLINLYMPHGGRDKSRIPYKLEAFRKLTEKIAALSQKDEERKTILLGDFNIAHTELDLARPKDNITNTMFTFPERIQIDKLIKLGFIDSFRQFHPEGSNYSWWPYFRDARERNLGWRIDYIFISDDMKSKLRKAFILRDIKGSDHCPIGVEMEF